VTEQKKQRTLTERFGKGPNPFEKKAGAVVGRTPDFKRIAHLPRRTSWPNLAAALTSALALQTAANPMVCPPTCVCEGKGYMVLRPRQAWAIAEAFEQQGEIGLLGPGEGKTIVTLLIPVVGGYQRPVLFVPASLKKKTLLVDIPQLKKHWRLHPNLEVCSYEELSREAFADYLTMQRIPDAVLADEGHALKNRGAGRTKRFLRFFQEHPEVPFFIFSGSLVHKSLMDYGHLTLVALKDGAPLPHPFMELKLWADAIDEDVHETFRPKPGALLDFCDAAQVNKQGTTPLITVREGYQRRLLETPGVISSPDLSTSVGLIIRERPAPPVPQQVLQAFMGLRSPTAVLPSGDFCATALEQNRRAKELSLGFHYRWLWPNDKIDVEWLEVRRLWKRCVRQYTTRKHGGIYYDTELQVANGIRRGLLEDRVYDVRKDVWVEDVYAKWVKVRDDRKGVWGSPEPPKKTEWISDYMLDEVDRWMKEHTKPLPGARGHGGIVWVESIGFLEKLRERGHVCFGAGENDIMYEKGDRHVVASLAHCVGKNLQMFSRCWFTTPVTSGKMNEQGLARLHRPGQTADDVIVDVSLLCREAYWSFYRARKDARYIEQTLGQQQRLNKATILVSSEEEVLERCDRGEPLWAETGFARMDDKTIETEVETEVETENEMVA
jgi:hypothetical protein